MSSSELIMEPMVDGHMMIVRGVVGDSGPDNQNSRVNAGCLIDENRVRNWGGRI